MDRLKVKRASRRTQTTKLINDATTALNDGSTRLDVINSLLERLTVSHSDLTTLNKEIEPHVREEELESEYVTVMDYEDRATETIANLRWRLSQSQTSPSPPQLSNVQTDVSRTPHAPRPGVKLPKLSLQQFRGDLSDWQGFWEQFRTTVHDNEGLSKIEKFHYLRSLLHGPAAGAIAGLQTSEASYDDAVEILTQRFGDRGRIEKQYLSKLRNLSAVTSADDIYGLRKLYDNVQMNVRGLRSLGVSSANYSAMLSEILLSSLPTDIVVEYHRSANRQRQDEDSSESNSTHGASDASTDATSEATRELNNILRFVRIEVESRERSGLAPDRKKPSVAPELRQAFNQRSTPSAAVLYSASVPKCGCLFCSDTAHTTDNCAGPLPLDRRKKRLADDRRCFRCTKRGHNAKECRGKMRCPKCGGRHAVAMCDPSWTPPKKNADGATATMLAAEDTPAESNTVLLQTFRSWVMGDHNCTYIRGVIDGGSQQTFIRKDVADKLRLNVLGNITVSLNTFGSTTATQQRQRCNVVEVRLRSKFAPTEFTVQAVTVPFICRDICKTTVEDELARAIRADGGYIADELLFPDIPAESGVSLLLGCDQLWNLTTGKIKRSAFTGGLVAIETSLGWTFQGPMSTYSCTSDSNAMICVLKAGVHLQEETVTSLRTLWELEGSGIADEPESNREIDYRGCDDFRENVAVQEGRYVVALPWKSAEWHLHNNRKVAQSRQVRLVRRLEKERARDDCDLLTNASTPEEESIVDSTNTIMSASGMELRKWASNLTELQNCFDDDFSEVSETHRAMTTEEVTRVLGITWDRTGDMLSTLTPLKQTLKGDKQLSPFRGEDVEKTSADGQKAMHVEWTLPFKEPHCELYDDGRPRL
ncbi:uncharacterized protein LOC135384620 [Ornithodoros turicata]|uniref:uncharacterized protein LOC135384620 n=1 Tax=Ornithodoros turicata TaxID=34597 RepID=UPI0031393E60